MRRLRRYLASLLVAMMLISCLPVHTLAFDSVDSPESGEGEKVEKESSGDTVKYNLGNSPVILSAEDFDDSGNYVIGLEPDAFFPYEVQFTYRGQTWSEWFETPEDTATVGGHIFSVESSAGEWASNAIRQLGVTINGRYYPSYPEPKVFTEPVRRLMLFRGSAAPVTRTARLDLRDVFPSELKNVKIDAIVSGLTQDLDLDDLGGSPVVYAKWGYEDENGDYIYRNDDYIAIGNQTTIDLYDYAKASNSLVLVLIVGTANQLDENNVKYVIQVSTNYYPYAEYNVYALRADATPIKLTIGGSTVISRTYRVHDEEEDKDVQVSYNLLSTRADRQSWNSSTDTEALIMLGLTDEFLSEYGARGEITPKLYAGYYEELDELTEAEAEDVTAKVLWSEASQVPSYQMPAVVRLDETGRPSESSALTLVLSRGGEAVLVQPFLVNLTDGGIDVDLYTSLRYKTDSENDYLRTRSYIRMEQSYPDEDTTDVTFNVDPTNVVDGKPTYYMYFSVYDGFSGESSYSKLITAAVASAEGKKYTAEEAKSMASIAEQLFTYSTGYGADYEKGVMFTIVDRNDDVHYYSVKVQNSPLHVEFGSLRTTGGSSVNPKVITSSTDSEHIWTLRVNGTSDTLYKLSLAMRAGDYESGWYGYSSAAYVKYAVPGSFDTVEAVEKAIADGTKKDIKSELFYGSGFEVKLAGGVVFTVVDANNEIHHIRFQTTGKYTMYHSQLYGASEGKWREEASYAKGYTYPRRESTSSYSSEADASLYYTNRQFTLKLSRAEDEVLYLGLSMRGVNDSETPADFGRSYVAAAYQGVFETIGEARESEAEDIADKLFSDPTKDGGYGADYTEGVAFTVFDILGDVHQLYVSARPEELLHYSILYGTDADGWREEAVYGNADNVVSSKNDGCTFMVRDSHKQDETLYLGLSMWSGNDSNMPSDRGISLVKAAYEGYYATQAEAVADGKTDIKSALFSNPRTNAGYGADFSEGVYFTVIDANNNVYRLFVQATDKSQSDLTVFQIQGASRYNDTSEGLSGFEDYDEYESYPVNGTGVWVSGVRDPNGNYVNNNNLKYDDTYTNGAFGYQTLFMMDSKSDGEVTEEAYAALELDAKVNELLDRIGSASDVSVNESLTQEQFKSGLVELLESIALNKARYDPYSTYDVRTYLNNNLGGTGKSQLIDSFMSSINEPFQQALDISLVKPFEGDSMTVVPIFTTYEVSGQQIDVFVAQTNADGTATTKKVISNETPVTFKWGEPVQFTAISADKNFVQNYWVTFLTPRTGSELFVFAANNPDHYTDVGGTKYPARTVHLTDQYDNRHDILLFNVGRDKLSGVKAELSDAVGLELADYWRLDTAGTLAPYDTVSASLMGNIAKLRLLSTMEEGATGEVSGKLTIHADSQDDVVIYLTGHAGKLDFAQNIDVNDGVKFVPYSSLLQTNLQGKSSEELKFSLESMTEEELSGYTKSVTAAIEQAKKQAEENGEEYTGKDIDYSNAVNRLPNGVTLNERTGEIYGVPKESGVFVIWVRVSLGYADGSKQEADRLFTIVIKDNTDENVDESNKDPIRGYEREQSVAKELNTATATVTDRTFISKGDYGQFVKFFLDGVELVRGTDYTDESGSTKITIATQTFTRAGTGSHTIAAEFRAADNSMRSTAQNVNVTVPSSGGSNSDSSDSGGSSSGGSSGGGSSGTTPSTGTSGSSNAPVEVKYTVSDGVANVTAPTAAELSTLALQAQNGTIEIGLTGNGETVTSVSLPAGMLEALSDAVERNPSASRVTFELSTGALQLDDVTLAAIAEEANGESVQMSLEEKPVSELNEAQRAALEGLNVEKVISALISAGEKAINGFHGGRVTLRVPFSVPSGMNPRGYQVWYVADSGRRSLHSTEVRNGSLSFRSSHFSDFVIAYAEPAVSYGDVADSAWYTSFVDYVSTLSLMNGVGGGSFAPDTTLTRAMFAQIIYNAEKGESGAPAKFSDVSADAWYADAVNWAAEAGIVSGVGSGRFSPNAQITREQLATMLYNYAGYKGYDVSRGASLSRFPDGGAVSAWADSAVQWAVGCKLIDGIDGALSAGGNATRAQTAKLLTYFFEGYEQ